MHTAGVVPSQSGHVILATLPAPVPGLGSAQMPGSGPSSPALVSPAFTAAHLGRAVCMPVPFARSSYSSAAWPPSPGLTSLFATLRVAESDCRVSPHPPLLCRRSGGRQSPDALSSSTHTTVEKTGPSGSDRLVLGYQLPCSSSVMLGTSPL